MIPDKLSLKNFMRYRDNVPPLSSDGFSLIAIFELEEIHMRVRCPESNGRIERYHARAKGNLWQH